MRGFAKCIVKLSVVTMNGDRHLFWFCQQVHYIFSEFLIKICSLLFKLTLIPSLMKQEHTVYYTIFYFTTFIFPLCPTSVDNILFHTELQVILIHRSGTMLTRHSPRIQQWSLKIAMELKKIPVSELWVWEWCNTIIYPGACSAVSKKLAVGSCVKVCDKPQCRTHNICSDNCINVPFTVVAGWTLS